MDLKKFNIIGISVRTTNENGQSGVDIGTLWQRFFAEDIMAKIPNRVNSEIYSVYTDYESDYTKPYTVVLGCQVANLETIPEGMVGRTVNGGKFAQFTANGKEAVYGEWMKIWKAEEELNRNYCADYEVYGKNGAEVDLFIGVKALVGKTVVITGASRGIGQAIALRYAAEGANVVIVSKDAQANIDETVKQIPEGKALAFNVDISDVNAIKQAVLQAVERFGGIDVLVNNTSAAILVDTEHATPEQFDLVVATSVRAAFFMAQACLPHLKKAENPHIINISPPMNDMQPHWFKDHLLFSFAKYAMSMCTVGMAEEFEGIAVNSLWPKATIATQSIKDLFLQKVFQGSRWPAIMGDAAYELLVRKCTGQFFTDEELLREAGMTDFSHYAVEPNLPLMQPLFIPLENGMKPITRDLFLASK